MKKGLFAFVLAAILSVVMVVPAFAANNGLNSNEQAAFDHGMSVANKWKDAGVLNATDVSNYNEQATAALNAVDLSKEASDEFIAAINKIDGMVAAQKEAGKPMSQIREALLSEINAVANKYNMYVSYKAGTHAQVTVTVKSTDSSGNAKTTTVASTGSTVKQTGFGLEQTAIVAAASVAVLAGAFFVARKKQLFQ